jgi:hypothetical protein
MLTHTRLREHPDIQEYIAQKIAPKGVTHKPAQSILRQTLCYCSAFLIV